MEAAVSSWRKTFDRHLHNIEKAGTVEALLSPRATHKVFEEVGVQRKRVALLKRRVKRVPKKVVT
jgi:hypothetical protein